MNSTTAKEVKIVIHGNVEPPRAHVDFRHGNTVEKDAAGLRTQEADGELHQCALASAGFHHERNAFARFDEEGEVVHRRHSLSGIGVSDVLELDATFDLSHLAAPLVRLDIRTSENLADRAHRDDALSDLGRYIEKVAEGK